MTAFPPLRCLSPLPKPVVPVAWQGIRVDWEAGFHCSSSMRSERFGYMGLRMTITRNAVALTMLLVECGHGRPCRQPGAGNRDYHDWQDPSERLWDGAAWDDPSAADRRRRRCGRSRRRSAARWRAIVFTDRCGEDFAQPTAVVGCAGQAWLGSAERAERSVVWVADPRARRDEVRVHSAGSGPNRRLQVGGTLDDCRL